MKNFFKAVVGIFLFTGCSSITPLPVNNNSNLPERRAPSEYNLAQSTCGNSNGSNAKIEQLTPLIFFEIVNDQSQNLEILPISAEFKKAAKIRVAPGESGFITIQIARMNANGSSFPQIVPNAYIDQFSAATAGIRILKQNGNDPRDIVPQEFMFNLADKRIFANCTQSVIPATFVFKASQLTSIMYFNSWPRK